MSSRSLSLLALLALAAPLRADTLKVPQQFATIQAAANVAAEGDVVLVSKGLYHENVIVTASGIELRGKSGAVIDGGYVGNCITVVGNDVEVTGFTLLSGGTGQLLVTDGPPNPGGLEVTGTNAKVSKLEVRACEGYGIKIRTGSVEHCTVEGCQGIGIFVDTESSLTQEVSTVSKCKVSRCGYGIVALEGPYVIEKNVTEQCFLAGIYTIVETLLQEAPPPITPSRVSNNTCTDNFQFGLYLEVGAGVTTAEKNTSTGNGYGMYVLGFGEQLLSNTVERNTSYGIILAASGTHLEKNKVRFNGGPGILVSWGEIVTDGAPESGSNHIQDCLVQDNNGDAIRITSNDNEVMDCVLKDNLGDGVQVDVDTTNNVLADLVIGNNGHDGIDNRGTNTTISGTKSKGNGGADLAGKGDGNGTTDGASGENVTDDGTGLASFQELDMETGDT